METLLKPGFDKILDVFYNEKRASVHLREMARRTKLNEHSTMRFLRQLEKARAVRAQAKGNLKQYTVNPTREVFAAFSYFDMRRLQRLPSIRRDAIHHFLAQLKEQPVIAIIFGSTAKETFTAQSDIDLLLVVNRKISVEDAQSYSESQTAINVNAIQISYTEFKRELKLREDAVIQSAIETGYPVTNSILYYEEYYAAVRP